LFIYRRFTRMTGLSPGASPATRFTEPGKTVFEKIPQSAQISEYCRIGDPSLLGTFKRIFSFGNRVNDFTGQARIISLLNSILYPTAGEEDLKIREVTPLPDRVVGLCERLCLDLDDVGVACRCFCWEQKRPDATRIFDIVIGVGGGIGFSQWLFEYGAMMKKANDGRPVVTLGVWNPGSGGGKQESWQGVCSFDMKTGLPLNRLEGMLDSYCVDLSKQMAMLRDNAPIAIGGKVLGTIGREWLQLLSLRYWAEKAGERYVVPRSFASEDAINSALLTLEHLTDDELKDYVAAQMRKEDKMREMEQRAAQEVKVMAVTSALANSERFGWTHEDVARIFNLSMEELAELMNSPEVLRASGKP
jgi:hypothetical protein